MVTTIGGMGANMFTVFRVCNTVTLSVAVNENEKKRNFIYA